MAKFISVFIVLLSATSLYAKKEISQFTYVDSSNNSYEIFKDSISYIPISKENSSSGEYSGGQAKTVSIDESMFLKIKSDINTLIKSKSEHVETRLMGCGTIILKKKTYYINMNSSLKENFEKMLRQLIETGKI